MGVRFVAPVQENITTNSALNRRTCRCCGRSIMFDERKAIDVFHPGLDVCPDCMPHMFEKSCIG